MVTLEIKKLHRSTENEDYTTFRTLFVTTCTNVQCGGTTSQSRDVLKAISSEGNKADICQICGVEYDSEADLTMEINSHWIHCCAMVKKDETCSYWIHSTCAEIYYPNDNKGSQAIERWACSKHFFCPAPHAKGVALLVK